MQGQRQGQRVHFALSIEDTDGRPSVLVPVPVPDHGREARLHHDGKGAMDRFSA